MQSFWDLMQVMEQEEQAGFSPLKDSGQDSAVLRVIRTGNSLRSKSDCGNFWNDFISIINDSDGLSELLDVPAEKIGGWAARIQEILDEISDKDGEESGGKAEILPTGNGPIANPGDGVDAMPSDNVDTRPMP